MSKKIEDFGKKDRRSGKRKKSKEAQRKLREKKLAEGIREALGGVSNRLSPYPNVDAERLARQEAVAARIQVYRTQLEKLLADFSKIPDPRRPGSVKHKLTVVLLYGLLSCLFQMTSRRDANATMSQPAFKEALQGIFPELETLPHADTLNRLLARIQPEALEEVHLNLLNRTVIFDRKNFAVT